MPTVPLSTISKAKYVHTYSTYLFAGGVVGVSIIEHGGVAVGQPLSGLPVGDEPVLRPWDSSDSSGEGVDFIRKLAIQAVCA